MLALLGVEMSEESHHEMSMEQINSDGWSRGINSTVGQQRTCWPRLL